MRAWILAATYLALIGRAMAGELTYTLLDFSQLDGWEDDDHAAALRVFTDTCGDMKDAEWQGICNVAKTMPEAKTFFELFFKPVLIEDGEPMLFTGYFEPQLNGSRHRGGKYQYPIYSRPPELDQTDYWYTRAQIEEEGILDGRGLEIAWLDDPVDAFFLHIQGSGRIRLDDGHDIRVGYAAKNGHNYRSIGMELVRRGVYQAHQVSAQVIRNWVRRNPEEGAELLRHNPSYVFFRELGDVPPTRGRWGR